MQKNTIAIQPTVMLPMGIRKPSVLRRNDFMYRCGGGTRYKFVEEYFPAGLLRAKKGELVSLIVRNCHVQLLEEIVFEVRSVFPEGSQCYIVRGYIDGLSDPDDCFAIKIDYFTYRPLESEILVYRSGRPFYG